MQYSQSERENREGPALGWYKNEISFFGVISQYLAIITLTLTQHMYDQYLAMKEVSRAYIYIYIYIEKNNRTHSPGR